MCKKFFSVYKHELNLARVTPGTWVFLGLANITMMVCAFYLANILGTNHAGLQPFFNYHPWILMFFVPALAMGTWAEEWRNGTAERLLTLPVSPLVATLGKFAAMWSVLFVLLMLSTPVVATFYYLGTPDWGPIVSGYIGSFLLGGAFLALSMVCSVVARSQAGAFSMALMLLFMVVALGWGVAINMFEGILPPQLMATVFQFSVLDAFNRFVAGVVDVRAFAFFVSLMLVGLWGTWVVLCNKLHKRRRRGVLLLLGVAVLAAGNYTLLNTNLKLDLTQEKLFTLSPASKNMVRQLQTPVNIDVYYSANNPDVPPHMQRFIQRVKDLLGEFKNLNPGMVTFRVVDPQQSTESEMTVLRHGVQEIPLPNGNSYYAGLGISAGGRMFVIPFLDPSRSSFLEFDLVSGFAQLAKTKRDKILIMTELNLADGDIRPRFMSELMAAYNVDVQPTTQPSIPSGYDLVVVFLTPFMGEEGVYALDQYIASGGKALIFLDPFMRTAPTADYQVPDRNADASALDHPADLLRHWGVVYDYNKVVGDQSRALPVMVDNLGMTTYPMWLFLSEKEISRALPFTRYLNQMYLIEPGFFQPQTLPEGLHYTPVLQTSASAQWVPRDAFEDNAIQTIGNELSGEPKVLDLAAMLTGTFTSAFTAMPASVADTYAYKGSVPPAHVVGGEKEGALIVVGDMDFLADDYALKEQVTAGKTAQVPANDNLPFVYNAIQYLLGDTALLSVRGHQQLLRPFTRIEAMVLQASLKYQSVEQQLANELFGVSQRVEDLRRRIDREKTASERLSTELENYKRKQLELKKQLRDVQNNFRHDIERLSLILAVGNTLAAPMLLFVVGGVMFRLRRRKH